MDVKIKLKKYKNTTNFIYELTAKRLRAKKMVEKITNFEIAGYKSGIEYSLLKDTPQATGYNPDIVKRMTSGNSKKKRFDYLLTKNYAQLFAQKLNFTDLHEVYWRNNDEIETYSENLFYYLLEDMKHDPFTRNNIFNLLELKTKEDIYKSVKKEFKEIFYQFTLGKITTNHDFDIASSINERFKFTDNGTLTFKKLDMNLNKFVHEKVFTLLTSEMIFTLATL